MLILLRTLLAASRSLLGAGKNCETSDDACKPRGPQQWRAMPQSIDLVSL
jgi:hypothetical protein